MENLIKTYLRNAKSSEFNALIQMAKNGHYPLFHPEWISETFASHSPTIINVEEQNQALNILDKLSHHTGIDKKRAVIEALGIDDRTLLIKNFLKIVENNILDELMTLQ
ncbi:MAG: hypothetical protein U0T83_03630 [Bacteriovoracaceae bacterium]